MVQYIQFLLATLNSREDEGQGMVEYGLIIALVSIVVIAILGTMGSNLTSVFTSAASALSAAS